MNKQGDEEAEKLVIAHYLVHRAADQRDARVNAAMFSNGKLGSWWMGAQGAAKGWRPGDLGIDPDSYALLAGMRPSAKDVNLAEKRIVRRWQVRYLSKAAMDLTEAIGKGEIEQPEEALNTVRQFLAEAESGGVAEARTHRDVGIELFREWTQALKSGITDLIPMPMEKLATALTGWQRGKFYLVGAVTSGHKTTFGRMACWHAAQNGHEALLWPMEDTDKEMAARTFAAEIRQVSTRTFTTYQRPDVTEADFSAMLQGLAKHLDSDAAKKLRYIDEAMPRLSRVLALLSAEVAKGLDFIALDFMQLIQPDKDDMNETSHWFKVSNALAAAAKRLNIPIVATVQPTQHATREQARIKRPLNLGDLRGGSAIAQSAYGVLLLNRVWDDEGELDRRFIDVEIAKWKNAACKNLRFKVEPHRDLILD